ncbi:2'-5' RNA ligase family protein [Brevundimonas sp. SPF441]|uniref:2'-5' RNA ligase family protein n=1 Tax=Brevundimonas sp. SPF441 TaxID=2663795 RepID=UPI001E5434B0|nr:2'-5' RNA ligase family protein [Brevundimonas sp. SPF441]
MDAISSFLPLIVTAALDARAFAYFEALRRRHFPPHLNQIPAHLTLFHALPGDQEPLIRQKLWAACAGRRPLILGVRAP